jgi:hypothetical protein
MEGCGARWDVADTSLSRAAGDSVEFGSQGDVFRIRWARQIWVFDRIVSERCPGQRLRWSGARRWSRRGGHDEGRVRLPVLAGLLEFLYGFLGQSPHCCIAGLLSRREGFSLFSRASPWAAGEELVLVDGILLLRGGFARAAIKVLTYDSISSTGQTHQL